MISSPMISRVNCRRWLGLAVATALVTTGISARSTADGAVQAFPQCPRKPTPHDIDAAKGMHVAADQYYAKAEYDKAITSWREAYNFDCNAHGLLINIGSAYEKLGETKRAIHAYETYITRDTNPRDPAEKETIEAKVVNLKALVERRPVPTPESPLPPSPTAIVPPSPTASPTAVPTPVPNGGDDGPGAIPWVFVGVGGAAVLAGGVLVGMGTGLISSAEDACAPDRINCEDQAAVDDGNQGRLMQGGGIISLGVGAAAIATGLVWALAAGGDDATATGYLAPTLTISPGPNGLYTLGLRGAF